MSVTTEHLSPGDVADIRAGRSEQLPPPRRAAAPARDAAEPASISPPVARLRLGRLLRDMRESCGRTQAEAALALECTKPKISKIETGKATIGPGDVRLLVGFYGVYGDPAEAVLDLARQARKRNHIRVPDWAQRFVALESISSSIQIYESELVPTLFRTDEYAKALSRAVDPHPADSQRLSTALNDRRAVLTRPEPPELSVVLNEAVVRRPVGGGKVLRGQLGRLRELLDRPHVTVQVLPFDEGAHPAMSTPFQLLRADQPQPSSVVYLEELIGSTYLDTVAQTDWYARTFDRLREAALSPERTAELLERLIDAGPC